MIKISPLTLTLCGVASGSYDQVLPILSSSASTSEESLKTIALKFTFTSLDLIGAVLSLVPDPTCHYVGLCITLSCLPLTGYEFWQHGHSLYRRLKE